MVYSDFVGFVRGGASRDSQPGLECGDGLDADLPTPVFVAASVLPDPLSA